MKKTETLAITGIPASQSAVIDRNFGLRRLLRWRSAQARARIADAHTLDGRTQACARPFRWRCPPWKEWAIEGSVLAEDAKPGRVSGLSTAHLAKHPDIGGERMRMT